MPASYAPPKHRFCYKGSPTPENPRSRSLKEIKPSKSGRIMNYRRQGQLPQEPGETAAKEASWKAYINENGPSTNDSVSKDLKYDDSSVRMVEKADDKLPIYDKYSTKVNLYTAREDDDAEFGSKEEKAVRDIRDTGKLVTILRSARQFENALERKVEEDGLRKGLLGQKLAAHKREKIKEFKAEKEHKIGSSHTWGRDDDGNVFVREVANDNNKLEKIAS